MNTRIIASALLGAALTLSLAACGTSSPKAAPAATTKPAAPAVTTTTAAYPTCAAVWQAGKAFPAHYDGCTLASGTIEAATNWDCRDGSQLQMIDALPSDFYTNAGVVVEAAGPAHRLDDDPGYSAAYHRCLD